MQATSCEHCNHSNTSEEKDDAFGEDSNGSTGDGEDSETPTAAPGVEPGAANSISFEPSCSNENKGKKNMMNGHFINGLEAYLAHHPCPSMLHACPFASEKARFESLLGQATDRPGSSCLQTNMQNNAAQTLLNHVKQRAKPCSLLLVGAMPSSRAHLQPGFAPENMMSTSQTKRGFMNENCCAYF